jgi:hydroxymethylglutaryl-CoA lyase
MSAHVDVVEVGPRDGLQSETQAVPTAIKVEFIRQALTAGIRRVEVTSFVHPRKVPQMADAEDVLRALGAPPAGTHFIGLVLNRKGFERAVAAGCNEIGMAVVVSDTFNRRNQGVSTDESIAAWLDIARAAEAAGVRAQVTVSAAFGCPFEGEIPVERVVDVARRVAEARPFEIALADTIGVGVPTQVTEIVSRVREAVPGIPLRCHFHNTRNTGFANVYAALQAGVRTFDASLGGIGGCPFAPAATGNIATEDLLYLLHRAGYRTGVSLDAVIETAKWLQQQLGRTVPGMLVKAGTFPGPAHATA